MSELLLFTPPYLYMDNPKFSYRPVEDYLSQVGKWVKQKYVERFGSEPVRLPHKHITGSGKTIDTGIYYYPAPFLKELFKVN